MIDLSNSFWIARARGGRGGRFTRWGRSDPAMVEGTISINQLLHHLMWSFGYFVWHQKKDKASDFALNHANNVKCKNGHVRLQSIKMKLDYFFSNIGSGMN